MTPKDIQEELIKVTVLRLDGVISSSEARRAEELLLDGTTLDASYAVHLAIEESGQLNFASELT